MIEQLGPYRVERVIGRGGMGAVYAGIGESGERVALKILQPDLASDENFRERFQAEIESLKKMRHPRIVELFGYGEQDGNLFYAMELVEGGSLQDELGRGRRFDWRDVTRITIDICQALKHAHDHGVIHRDLKPANLLLDRDERVKLTDFGIAKLFGARSQTVHGGVMGTADFMAPEQAEGQPATARCDLYSLGCVMFALLTGHPPFRGKSLAEVVHQLRYVEPPRVRHFSWDVPIGLDETIDLLLRKDPQQRIPTALALGNRLQALLHSLSVGPTTSIGVEVSEVSNSPTIQYASAPVPQLPS
ncbi:MAG: serine/threonine-protein kinase, partial [Planctomycetota bacterium]|nr:serine/threonine-protein kinase [Planctomycetota bacterium]